MNNQNDYYQTLGIPPNAKIDIIKKAYREKALRYHPDRGGTHEQMVLINEAWAILSDPARRKIYDNAQIYRTDEVVQKQASADREYARRDARDYPRTWSNFEKWMDEAFSRVESKKLAPGLVIPNPKKDIIGWMFVIAGGLFTIYLSFLMGFTQTGSIYVIPRFFIFSFGGWLGWLIYQYFSYSFVNKSTDMPNWGREHTYKNATGKKEDINKDTTGREGSADVGTNGGKEYTCPILNDNFVLIPAGTFMMGSPEDEPGRFARETLHKVTISKPFYMQTTPVTQGQWQRVMGSNPSYFKGDDNLPVEQVSWNDVQEFISKLNKKEGKDKYRLPTAAQWEYACRAGSSMMYWFGDDPIRLGEYAWYDENSGNVTHPVGRKKPNTWGLYDMYGNVWEWVQDWGGSDCDYPSGHLTDPTGPSSGPSRVFRGGSGVGCTGSCCRTAFRAGNRPGSRDKNVGFRLLKTY
jgi:formylglycine-generating enzyme required for sulfatase activity